MSALPVIITRAEPGASQTAQQLAGRTDIVLKSPVLEIEGIVLDPAGDLPPRDGVIFTSINGVRAWARMSDARQMTAWCVGGATAIAARQAGFTAIRDAGGNSEDLVELILATAPETARLVHAGNEEAAGEIVARLGRAGLAAKFLPLYRMRPAAALTSGAAAAIQASTQRGEPVCVLFHSAKGADAFRFLARDMDLTTVIAIAISENAATPLVGAGLQKCVIAEAPNEHAILQALESVRFAL